MKNDKKRLFEVFEKVNKITLKEWYDDEYHAQPEKMGNFNSEDIRQVKELFTLLSVDGIEDIYDVYPRWLVDMLKNDGYIHENPQYFAWEFTPEGREYFEDGNDLQEYLLDKEQNSGSNGNDSEAPFLRGREDSNISM